MQVKLCVIIKTIFLILVFNSNIKGQEVTLKRVSIDEFISVDFPTPYEKLDTLYQNGYIFRSEDQTLILSTMILDDHNNKDLNKLKKYYKNFIGGILKNIPNSDLISEDFVTIDSLVGKKIKYNGTIHEKTIEAEAFIIAIKNKIWRR